MKLTTEVFVGGVSEIVRLSDALPPPPQFVVHAFFTPLHELSVRITASAIHKRDFFEFIHTPHDRIWQTAPDGPDGWESPRHTVAPRTGPHDRGKRRSAQLLTVLEEQAICARRLRPRRKCFDRKCAIVAIS